jgi:hypothetical protein
MKTEKKLFIPENYSERTSLGQYFDMGMKDEWQKEVYEKASEIYTLNGFNSVVDLGCGSAYKLLNYFPKEAKLIGVEEEITYNWLTKEFPDNDWLKFSNDLQLESFDLLVCSDVVEHIVDIFSFMDWIEKQPWKIGVLSTPDRSLLYDASHKGPPGNGSHVREWTFQEFNDFVSQWFKVEEHLITNKGQATQTIIIKKL